MFNYQDFGLKEGNLYEIIATTYSISENGMEIKPNASCMGIRMIEGEQIQISPYYSTITYKNLKQYSTIAINFVDDIYLYALAALKEPNSQINLTEFPSKYFDFKYLESRSMDVPYIKKAWGILIGEVSHEFQKTKTDDLGEIIVPIFKLDVVFTEKFLNTHKLFNRTENLVLEVVILATRLKIARDNQNHTQLIKLNEKIEEYIDDIERFGYNKRALKTIELVKNEFYYYESRKKNQRNLILLTGDYQGLSSQGQYELVDTILEFSKKLGVKEIYTLGGYGLGQEIRKPKVLCATTHKSLVSKMKKYGAVFKKNEPGGGIVGASGLLLGLGKLKGFKGVCFMGETPGYLVDPTSAKAVLKIIQNITGVDVDLSALEEKAKEIEQIAQQLHEMESGGSEKPEDLKYIG